MWNLEKSPANQETDTYAEQPANKQHYCKWATNNHNTNEQSIKKNFDFKPSSSL